MRVVVALTLVLGLTAAGAQGATRATPPTGQYDFSHAAGHNEFIGGLKLHGSSITAVGITTDLLACTNPPSTKVQYPGPPDNWQPQKTIPVKRHGANLTFSYSGTFADRISGYPQSMQLSGTITPAGVVTGKVALQEDDNTASTGESKCKTRGFVPFTGKHS
jgi:hypothetical protein